MTNINEKTIAEFLSEEVEEDMEGWFGNQQLVEDIQLHGNSFTCSIGDKPYEVTVKLIES